MKFIYRIFLMLILISSNGYAVSTYGTFSMSQPQGYTLEDTFQEANKHYDAKNYIEAIDSYSLIVSTENIYLTSSLKKLAFCYASINNPIKSTEYASRYIRSNHETDFLKNDSFEVINNSTEFKELKKKYVPYVNALLLFYFYSGLVGIYIAIILNLKRKNTDKKATILISLFVLLHSLLIIHISLYVSNYTFSYPHTMYITTTFSFLYGPLLYFYFKRSVEDYKFKWVNLLHILPSIALIIYMMPFYILSAEEKLHLMLNRDQELIPTTAIIVLLKSISLIIYAFLIYKTYRKNRYNSYQVNYDYIAWQKKIVILNFVFVFSYLMFGAIITKVITLDFLIHPQIISMSLFVLFVGYSAYANPHIFNKQQVLDFEEIYKYKKSGLTENYSLELKEQLIELFTIEKVFKDNHINLDKLSEKLNTTRHNASQIINEHFNVNFFEFTNKFRIDEAKEILKTDPNKNLNIIDIAYEVGFNNKVTFNKAFKKETGLTPTQYLYNLQNPNQNIEGKLSVSYFRHSKLL